MKRVRRISKKYYLRQIMACLLACYMLFGLPIQIARAAPTGGTFTEGGTGTIIDGIQDSSVTVNQAVSFIDWDSFDTSSTESVTFLQGLMSNSAVLNRISGSKTQFDGLLSAVDMRIFLLNPAGIIFGEGSSVNANQLVASSMKMKNEAFLDAIAGGDLVFTNPTSYEGDRIVANYGTINAADSVYLVGKNVLNAGTIITNPGGLVAMVAGDEMTLGQPGSPTIVKTLVVNHIENHTVDNGAIGGTSSNLYDQFGIDASSSTGTVSTGELVLAAGDVWSNAVENVEDLTAVARGDIHFEEAINITGDLKAQAGLTTKYDSDWDYLGKYKHDPDDYFSKHHFEEQGVLVKLGGDVHAKDTITAGGSIDVLANGIQFDADVSAGPDADDNMTLTGRWGEDPIDGFHDIVTAGLTAGGNIDISVTGVTDQKVWEYDDWDEVLFTWYHPGQWVSNSTPTYEPGTITLNGDVAAIAGNLTISNITDVKVPATLSAGTNLVLENSSDPYENAETLTGTDSLTLAAGNEVQADNTTISVTGSELSIQQGLTLDTADYLFDLQGTTHLTLISDNGSVFSTDTADGGKDENAADQWASISATANGGIILSGHEKNINANRLEAAHGPIEVDAKTNDILASDDIVASGGGNITLTGKSVIVNGDIDAHYGLGIRPVGYNSDLTIEATDDIELNGYADIDGDMVLSADDDVTAKGNLIAGGSIDIDSSNYTTYLGGDLIEAVDDITLYNNTKLNGISGAQRIEATTGTLTAMRDVEKTTEGNLNLAGGSGIVLGDDAYTYNGDLTFENDVTANGTCSRRNQLFDADRWSDSYENDLVAWGSITKTTSGSLTLDGGSGDSMIYVAGDVSTSWGDLTFEDDVIANGEGDQTFTAGPFSGFSPLSRLKIYGSVTKQDGGDVCIDGDGGSLTLESGWKMDVDGDITVDDGDLTVEADQHIDVGGNVLAKGDILIRADKDLDAEAHQGDPLYGGDVDVDGDITSTQGSIDIYSTDFTTYLGGDVDAAYDVTLHNSTILDGEGDQTVEAGKLGDGTLTAGSWMWKTTYGHLYLIGNNDDPEHRDGKAIDLQYAGCLPAASTCLGNLELLAPNGDIQISGDLTTFGLCCGVEPGPRLGTSNGDGDFLDGWYNRPTGGVSVIAENGKIYTEGASPENDTLNIGIVGNSDDVSHRVVYENGGDYVEVSMGPLGVDLPYDEGKAAIVVMSNEDLKFGPDTMLIAKGTYDDSVVDDRAAVNFLDTPDTMIGGATRNQGDAIDVAVYLASTEGDVHLDGRAIDVAEGGTMVVDAYDTVTFGDFDTFNLEGFGDCEDLGCFLIKLAMRFHDDIDFQDLCEAIQAYEKGYEWDDKTYKEFLEDFLNDYFDEGFFFNIDRLEVVSRVTEWLYQAASTGNGTLPYAGDDGAIAAFEAFIGGDYILRGAGLDNPEITDGRAWVLENPAVPEPLDVQYSPQVSGCPAAMEAVANELAIEEGTLQISIGGMLALNPTIQPCSACAGLLNAAAILRDEDGSRMAALNQVFNEQAPANVPFSPAMATSIVTAFADQVDDGSQSNYATAMEYIDAFVQYVAILDTQLGSPVEDSTAFVMAKYGAGITESENSNIAAFVAARLAGLESF